ncbi:hypothetical protein BCR37DRAFT_387872 [Protomyces lactucae-debilis]|uniref:Uncharacterized protein n=1 Tax=Protomyces lactucae-debilis TaxID=2754530 RepID=A0A1Y2FA94_PROLT|nr:uncharacterized protein BCR37DRAFT_387872 [Protomyces lactucae-debilis]ORY80821.1 hypothetical protein BCR37DRAFT_387872 [Protomyces lactucae-debilis]
MQQEQSDNAKFFGQHLPLDYWSTLNAHSPLTVQTQFSALQNNLQTIQQQQEADLPALRTYFNDELSPLGGSTHGDGNLLHAPPCRPYSKIASPTGTRACSSLLSELLKPAATPPMHEGVASPSSTIGTHGDLVSDHGSLSTHSTPPMQASPPPVKRKTCISFACAPMPDKHPTTTSGTTSHAGSAVGSANRSRACSIATDKSAAEEAVVLPKRTITFACGAQRTSPEKAVQPAVPVRAGSPSQIDTSCEATPVPKRTISFAAAAPSTATLPPTTTANTRPTLARATPSDASGHSSDVPLTNSTHNSRRPSMESVLTGVSDSRRPSLTSVGGASPVLQPRQAPTCKSTLDAMLQKEKIAKVIEPVLEEDEDEDADELDPASPFELDSDDDGYVEDVESDEDPDEDEDELDEGDEDDLLLTKRNSACATPRQAPRFAQLDLGGAAAMEDMDAPLKTPVYRPACPSESDLPDTTDFAPGTLDEDQPACVAFDCAVRDRALARRIATPQDIDPTFPDSGSGSDSEAAVDRVDVQEAAKLKAARRGLGRSPVPTTTVIVDGVEGTGAMPVRLNSPPPARKSAWALRARSLPARRPVVRKQTSAMGGKEGMYAPKPQRAVTIKQSNEQRAQRRRDKRELRHQLQGGPKPVKSTTAAAPTTTAAGGMESEVSDPVVRVDVSGHEKMKAIGCKTRKQAENPCLIRPVMSI